MTVSSAFSVLCLEYFASCSGYTFRNVVHNLGDTWSPLSGLKGVNPPLQFGERNCGSSAELPTDRRFSQTELGVGEETGDGRMDKALPCPRTSPQV